KLREEQRFRLNSPPLSWTTGVIPTPQSSPICQARLVAVTDATEVTLRAYPAGWAEPRLRVLDELVALASDDCGGVARVPVAWQFESVGEWGSRLVWAWRC